MDGIGSDEHTTDIDSDLFRLLLICAHRLEIEAAARTGGGETVMGLLVLQLLAGPKPPGTGRELAGTLGCTRSAVTQTLDRLERRGRIRRQPSIWDSRVKNIELTDDARKTCEDAREPVCALMQCATASLTLEEKQRLVSLLQRLDREFDHARITRVWGGD